ncbi:hypothetical protein TWF106_007993 [Orbilia oligospora]|uniref:Uncharacterized protein n=1 Tax=Orbilia oligospora TaxID=2813651 RepID=A0A7C8UPT6_ORBOL|nr:hypothetical protein TWF106_007993 [Orbilia oligospora]
MIEFSLALVVYAVSYLRLFVDPSYIEQKLNVEFQNRQMEGVPATAELKASEEAALLYVNELRHQQEENLANGRPCFKPSRFYQPFYACVESTGYEAELQVTATQVPDPSDSGLDAGIDGFDDGDEDRRRYEEQVARQMKVQREDSAADQNPPPPPAPPIAKSQPQAPPKDKAQAPPRKVQAQALPPLKVPVQAPPKVQVQALPPPPVLPARIQVAANPVPDVRPLALRVRPPTLEQYGYGDEDDYNMGDPNMMLMDDGDCDEFGSMGMPGGQSLGNPYSSYGYGIDKDTQMPTGAIVLTPLSGEEACCGVSTLTNTLRLYTRPYWRIAHSDGKPRTREFELDTADTAE